MPDSPNYVFGANILDNLTTGMYPDSKIIYREYIQNACDSIDKAVCSGLLEPDEGTVEIYVNDSSRSITIRDNGTGILASSFRSTLSDIANSEKTLGEAKGFRGIGRLCGLAYCETLIFASKASGETTISRMKCNAERMRHMIIDNQSRRDLKLTAAQVLNTIISYDSEKSEDISEHWFEVRLINVNPENHELLDKESVIDYLSFVAPVPYSKNFTYRKLIYDYAQEHKYPLCEYVIKFNGEQIFKDYRTHVKTSKGEDHIFGVDFYEIYDDENHVIAWMWYGLRTFQAVIERESPQRGLRLRKENIQIGDETALQRLFKEERGTNYFIGEVHAISHELIPNSQRDYFNENQMRNIFEREAKQFFSDTLYKLYHIGNDLSSAVNKIDAYQKECEEFDQKQKKGSFINKSQRQEAEGKLERAKRSAETARAKLEKAKKDSLANPNSPISKVAIRIASNTKQVQKNNGDSPPDTKEQTPDNPQDKTRGKPPKSQPQWWADRLTSVPRKSRKLINDVLGVVWGCVDEATMNTILERIEEMYK